MAFSKVVYLYCDGRDHCPAFEASWGDSQYDTVKEYKHDMKQQGWHFVGRKCYCPDCWDARK